MARKLRHHGKTRHKKGEQETRGKIRISNPIAVSYTHLDVYKRQDNTLVGWREDFHMSFETPVPAQVEALAYLRRQAERTERPLRVAGHSKGGNLAAYAAAHLPPEIQRRILSVCSFDGPGLDEDTMNSPGYERIRPVLHSVLPQSSIVGLLMHYHPDYLVVRLSLIHI